MLLVKDMKIALNLTSRQIVSVIRDRYPGYDKYLHSKVENPEKYGVRLVNDAEQLLEEAFTRTTPKPRKPDKRRLTARVQCRMTKGKLEALQQAFHAAGFDTVQAGIGYLIDQYLQTKKAPPSDE